MFSLEKYINVVVNNESVQTDQLFTYKVKDTLLDKIKLGQRILVPFGIYNKSIDAFVLEYNPKPQFNVKNIKEIIDIKEEQPLLNMQNIRLIKIMKAKYLCTYLDCVKVLIPRGLLKNRTHKIENKVFALKPLEGKFNKEPYIEIYNIVEKNQGKYNRNSLKNLFHFSTSSINTLIKYGYLGLQTFINNRYNNKEYSEYKKVSLNINQTEIINGIINSDNKMSLVHGVTGSGKTEIYLNLVEIMLKENKDSIILVPEISLTPQMVERFKGRFGKDITVFHSKLSEGQRFDEWMRVKNGEVKVAVGARSALFLPFKDLGLIIIDEEHETSYKSDSNPKYDVREIAEIYTELTNCKLVLGSATPSIETYYKSLIGKYKLYELKKRVKNISMPEIRVVDMREELKMDNKSILSRELYEDMKLAFENNEQVLLFLNRRGFSTFVSCRECGYVFKCDNCDISLTYHHNTGKLNCHYCGKKYAPVKKCPKCGSKYVKYFGTGTEKVEKIMNKIFPEARTIRMDFDTTRGKNSYEDLYLKFKNREADILIGTQMIAKGLDFDNLTVVGILAADISLNIPDYRSEERTFQLITQVSGRAGRGNKQGRVVIQTYNPENYAIQMAIENNYIDFYNREIEMRKNLYYPPFSKLILVNLSSKEEEVLIKNIHFISNILKQKYLNNDKIVILGPSPCSLNKIKNLFRWQIIIKGKFTLKIANEIKDIIYKNSKKLGNKIRISIDVNPSNLL